MQADPITWVLVATFLNYSPSELRASSVLGEFSTHAECIKAQAEVYYSVAYRLQCLPLRSFGVLPRPRAGYLVQ